MLVVFFGNWAYHVIGVMETIKGCLAFVTCPMFGRLSDVIGRRKCLLITVLGTSLPILSLAFVSSSMWTFVSLQSLSGCFAGTFSIVFAYIADFVPVTQRASAYGLALAMFGLSHSIGPITGGYLSMKYTNQTVFVISFILVCTDILYIAVILPESVKMTANSTPEVGHRGNISVPIPSILRGKMKVQDTSMQCDNIDNEDSTLYIPFQWNPLKTFNAFDGNPLLHRVAVIVFLYYTGVWALVSTLLVYVTRKFEFDAVTIGHLLGAYGACTVFAEGVLVRYLVPWIGEKLTMQLGLLGFMGQCIIIGLADTPFMIFASMAGSLLSNLMYPAMSSLVSKNVRADVQGEVLGTINGVRALTEGFGPLIFGLLMSKFEGTLLPGAPYLIAGGFSLCALIYSFGISEEKYSVGTFGIDVDDSGDVELEPLMNESNRENYSSEEE